MALLVDLGPLLVDTPRTLLVLFLQLHVGNQQFRSDVDQPVQFDRHGQLLVSTQRALAWSDGEEVGVGNLDLGGGGGTLKRRIRSVGFSRCRTLRFSLPRKQMALAETIIPN